ncbi:MAG: recombinase-like helix-turn-helix domain-containing protein [Streptosporangiaceae bacterium]
MLPVIDAIRAAGVSSLAGVAAALNDRGVASPRGGRWTATAVRRVLARTMPQEDVAMAEG